MPNSKRLTFRFDDEIDRSIKEKCESLGCTKSEYIESLVRAGIDEESEHPMNPGRTPGEAYDMYNEKTGGIDRFDKNGKNIFHFKPTEYLNGTQYYRDTMGDNPTTKWYKDEGGNWIQIVICTNNIQQTAGLNYAMFGK